MSKKSLRKIIYTPLTANNRLNEFNNGANQHLTHRPGSQLSHPQMTAQPNPHPLINNLDNGQGQGHFSTLASLANQPPPLQLGSMDLMSDAESRVTDWVNTMKCDIFVS